MSGDKPEDRASPEAPAGSGQVPARPPRRPPPPPRRGPPPLPGQVKPGNSAPADRPSVPRPLVPPRPIGIPRPTPPPYSSAVPRSSAVPPHSAPPSESERPEESSPLSRTWVGGIVVPGAPPLAHAPGGQPSPPPQAPSAHPPLGSRPPPARSDGPSGWPVAPVSHRPASSERPSERSWRPSEPSIPRAPAVPSGVFDATAARSASEPAKSDGGDIEELKRNLQSRTLKLEAVSAQRDVLRSRVEKTERELERKSEELEKLHRQHESLRNLVALRADRIRELENSLTQKNAALAERDRTIADLSAKLAAQQKALAPRDDLTRIRGIGPKYAKKLQALGITSYRQIAAWSDDEIERIAGELGARKKRILSAGWRESAAALLPKGAPAASTSDEVDQGW